MRIGIKRLFDAFVTEAARHRYDGNSRADQERCVTVAQIVYPYRLDTGNFRILPEFIYCGLRRERAISAEYKRLAFILYGGKLIA